MGALACPWPLFPPPNTRSLPRPDLHSQPLRRANAASRSLDPRGLCPAPPAPCPNSALKDQRDLGRGWLCALGSALERQY